MSPPSIENELRSGRGTVAGAIVFAHALKHLYMSGQSTLIIPKITIDLNLSKSQHGLFGTASNLGWWSATMVSGYLGDRFSRRAGVMLTVSMMIMGVSMFLMGFAPGYSTILPIMFFAAIGPAMFHPPAIGELSRRFPDRRGFAVSLHGMAANFGEVLGPVTMAGLLSLMVWKDVLKAGLIPAIIAGIVIFVLIPSRKSIDNTGVQSLHQYFSSLLNLLSNKILFILILTTALRNFGESAVAHFLPLYLQDDLGYSPTTIGWLLAASQLSGVISQPAMGFMSDKVGSKPVIVTGTALTMVSAFALSVVRPGIQLFVAVLIRGSLIFSLHHIVIAAALDAAKGASSSTVTSLIYGAGFMSLLSPYIAGIISDRYGIQSAFVYGGLILIIPTLTLLLSKFPDTKNGFISSDNRS